MTTLKEACGNLDVPLDTVEPKIKALISDGASVMGALVDSLNRKRRRNPILWVRDVAHSLVRSIAAAKNGCKGWYKAIDQVISLLAIFYRTSSKRMRGLARHRGRQTFRKRIGVRWVEAMSRELNAVLANLQAVQKHVPEYITSRTGAGRKRKAEDLLEAVSHEIFSILAALFADVSQVVCVTSKNAQHKHSLKVDVVRGMVNALCSQLMYMKRKPVDGGWALYLPFKVLVLIF